MRMLRAYGIIGVILHAISPLALIWSLNTLFNLGIPYSLKTWLAGLLLIYVVRFHLRSHSPDDPAYLDDFDDDDEEEEEEEVWVMPKKPEMKAEASRQRQEKPRHYQPEQETKKGRRK
jgi:hypothetical protein